MDDRPSEREPVFVVGAGVAGLAAATRLRQLGWPVIVLESRDYVGGRVRTVTDGGYLLDTGAMMVGESYNSILSLAREAGVHDQLAPVGSLVDWARPGGLTPVDTGKWVKTALRTPLLSWRSKLTMTKAAWDFRRMRSTLSDEDLSEAADFDTETAAGYCRRRLNREIFENLVDTCVRALLAVGGDEVSKVDFFYGVNKFLAGPLFHFPTGLSTYTNRLAANLDVRLQARVMEITETGAGVRVLWEDATGRHHTEEGAGCVLAVPGNRVADMAPGLANDVLEFLRRIRYTATISVQVGLARPPSGCRGFMVLVPASVHPGLSGIAVDHNLPGRVPPGKGLLGLYVMTDWAEKLADQPDDVVTRNVVDAAERIFPGVAGDVEFSRVTRWDTTVVFARPGFLRELGAFRKHRPHGRIHLAGDYFSSSNLNTASLAGERAGRELDTALRRSP